MSSSKPHSLAKSIAVAEATSTAVSLGAVLLANRFDEKLQGACEFLAKYVTRHFAKGATEAEQKEDALNKASTLLKGGIMIGAGFATHIPVQMAMEGRADVNEFKKVVFGKGSGVAVTLGGLFAANKLAPKQTTAVLDTITETVAKCSPKKHNGVPLADHEFCHLLAVDVPSSLMSGVINYLVTSRSIGR